MRKLLSLCIMVIFVSILVVGCSNSQNDQKVNFEEEIKSKLSAIKDECLYESIYYSIDVEKVNAGETTLAKEIDSIKVISFSNKKITSFEGIEICKNVKEIVIYDCTVNSFSGIENLNYLEKLEVNDCDISKKSWKTIQYCNGLKTVMLSNVYIGEQVKYIARNKNIKKLHLYNLGITNANCFAGKKNIKVLDLQGNKISDISKWSDSNMNPKLRFLISDDSYVLDYSNIKKLVEYQKKYPLYDVSYDMNIKDAFSTYINGVKINFKNHSSRRRDAASYDYISYVDGEEFMKKIGGSFKIKKINNYKNTEVELCYKGIRIKMYNLKKYMYVDGKKIKSDPLVVHNNRVAYIPVEKVVKQLGGKYRQDRMDSLFPKDRKVMIEF